METKKPDGNKKALDDIVGQDRHKSRVYFLSEVGYDTAYFNPDAYANLLNFMSEDKELSGIIIDGPVTRLDRPEYLNDELSYWTKSEEECKVATDSIPNNRQYKSMMETQLSIIEKRLLELKEKVPQAKQIVLSIDSDDIQYTVSAMVNEMLIRGQKEIGESIKELRAEKKRLGSESKTLEKQYAKEESASRQQSIERRMKTYETRVTKLDEKIANKTDEQKLYREKKVRPAHQYFTARFVKKLYGSYKDLCDRLGVTLVTKPSVLQFEGLVVDYAHSRHSSWAVLKRRDKALIASTHGKMDSYEDRMMQLLKKSAADGVDVILESGHSGIGYKQLQKTKDTAAESNFKNQSSYDPDIGDSHITMVMALPFEDQQRISRFVRGDEAVRMSGGKPINTRKHAVIDRNNNDGVSGLTILTKDERGLVGTEWVQYQNFSDGSVLKQPADYSIICASGDEHICSPEENLIARDGLHALFRELLQGTTFRGKQAFTRGYINGGDVGEANSRKWTHRYHDKRSPGDVLKENIGLLAGFKPDSVDDLVRLAMKMTNDARGGGVENMSVVLERVADYYEAFLNMTLASPLKWAHVSVPGNHTDDVLKDLGFRDTDFFVQRLKAKGIGVYEVGKPDYFKAEPEKDARVFIGGYSNARIVNVPDYGKSVDGSTLFGPINLVVQHDPKGSGMKGVTGAGKNCGADVSLGAHTHETWLRLYKTGDNSFSVAYKLGTLQGVSPTEKYYAESVPRTQAAHLLVMPMQGDFAETAVPACYLSEVGRDAVRESAETELGKKRNSKK